MSPEPSLPALVAEADLGDGTTLAILRVGPENADVLLDVIRAAFAARPPVDPPPAALAETAETIGAKLSEGFGLLGTINGHSVGAILVGIDGSTAHLTRVGVRPEHQHVGIAGAMVTAAWDVLAFEGLRNVGVETRVEFPGIANWWRRHGFVLVGSGTVLHQLRRRLPVALVADTADDMIGLGQRMAGLLRAGDLIIATGELGAGKTTLAQGIGAGLDVGGPVISPTFVLSRVHPPRGDRPGLVHVDAYRLDGFDELEDLDLEDTLARSVTLVEWGAGIAEPLADSRLEIDIRRGLDPADDARWVFLTGVGERWQDAGLEEL